MSRILQVEAGGRFSLTQEGGFLRTYRIDRFSWEKEVWLTHLEGNSTVQAYFYDTLNDTRKHILRLPEILTTDLFIRFYGSYGQPLSRPEQVKTVAVFPVAAYEAGDFIGFRADGRTHMAEVEDVGSDMLELRDAQSRQHFNIGILVPTWVDGRVAHIPSVCGWDEDKQQLTTNLQKRVSVWPILKDDN